MKRIFQNPTLVISAASKLQWPKTTLPEVVLAGKSNVGKSSLINALVQRKNLAYVGQTPGKTRLLNFYNLDDELMLVDAPGYGYAKRSKFELAKYAQLMDDYFGKRENIAACLLVLDMRHLPSKDDIVMYQYLQSLSFPYAIVLTKSDKLSYSQRLTMKRDICQQLACSLDDVIVFSANDKTGVEMLWDKIEAMLSQ